VKEPQREEQRHNVSGPDGLIVELAERLDSTPAM
jgi:hypothetical protein